ncbi:MAG: hypothetical protein HYZ73_05795 [Elusimicrobia bacterium]|nr:hypothetical protein [Elusimicrobiota bacterium]
MNNRICLLTLMLVTLGVVGVGMVRLAAQERTKPNPVPPDPSLFGLDVAVAGSPRDYNIPGDLDKAQALNARWIRLWIAWNEIEEKRGRFNFSELDRQVRALSARGFGILAVVMGAPRYACRVTNPPKGFDFHACPPKLPEYRQFLRTLVTRYGKQIKYWEIWNEPNDATFWWPRPNPQEYAELLKVAYQTIKGTDPSAKVLIAAVGPIPDEQGDEIEGHEEYYPFMAFAQKAFTVLDGHDAFDIATLHPYRFPKGPLEPVTIQLADGTRQPVTFKDELLAYKSLLDQSGRRDDKVWITEIGWLANDDSHDRSQLVSERQQAEFLQQTYLSVINSRELGFVESIFWFALKDLSQQFVPDTERFYGLVKENGVAKPAFEAYRRLARGH